MILREELEQLKPFEARSIIEDRRKGSVPLEYVPFFTVGRLTVEHQAIDFEKQFDFCENLTYSPWNGLKVHRPVGALNRLRRVVYPLIASYRLKKQGIDELTGTPT